MASIRPSDQEKFQAAMAQHYDSYPTPPVTSPSGQRSSSNDLTAVNTSWPLTFTSADSSFSPLQSYSWAFSEPCGLGLVNYPVTTDGHFHQGNAVAAHFGTSQVWYSGLPDSTIPAEGIRKDSITMGYPSSTMAQPTNQAWGALKGGVSPFLPMVQPSPGQSDFGSICWRPSAASPTDLPSQNFKRPMQQPLTKLEEPQSLVVTPNDLFNNDPATPSTGPADFDSPRPAIKFESTDDENLFAGSHGRMPSPYCRETSSPQNTSGIKRDADDHRKRAYTTQANMTCSCEKCGKLFQRSYNLKAHMETHDPQREHPHVCEWADCRRRFVRRTDLSRHEQSVRSTFPDPRLYARRINPESH